MKYVRLFLLSVGLLLAVTATARAVHWTMVSSALAQMAWSQANRYHNFDLLFLTISPLSLPSFWWACSEISWGLLLFLVYRKKLATISRQQFRRAAYGLAVFNFASASVSMLHGGLAVYFLRNAASQFRLTQTAFYFDAFRGAAMWLFLAIVSLVCIQWHSGVWSIAGSASGQHRQERM